MRHVLLAVSLLAVSASVGLVAQARYLPNAPGTWKPWRFNAYADQRRVLGARPADVKDLEAQLLRLNAIVKKTDGFTNPVGFSVETVGDLGPASGRLVAIAGEPALTVRPSNLGSTSQNWIGRSQYSGDPFLNAAIDSFRVYSRALSAAEVADLFSTGT